MARLKLSLLGTFQVILDGNPITGFESNKVRALLAYLAAEPERPQRRESLADLLWPGWPAKSAMRNLTFALADLRKNIADQQAQPPFLVIRRVDLRINPQADIWVDLWEFDRVAAHSSKMEDVKTALELYRGPFLEGFSLPDSSSLEDWLATMREKVKRQVVNFLGKLEAHHESRGEIDQALSYAGRQLELEPWLE